MSEKVRRYNVSPVACTNEKPFGFPEKLENVYLFKGHFNPDCFETNSWVEIPEEGFKHTREKSSYSVTQEIPA